MAWGRRFGLLLLATCPMRRAAGKRPKPTATNLTVPSALSENRQTADRSRERDDSAGDDGSERHGEDGEGAHDAQTLLAGLVPATVGSFTSSPRT